MTSDAARLRQLFGPLPDEEIIQITRRRQIMQGWREELAAPRSLPPCPGDEEDIEFALPAPDEDTIVAAAAAYAARDLSPVELVKHMLLRIERLDGTLHSYITVLPEAALAQAREAEVRMMRRQPRGPLDGIPYNLKDIIDTAGIRTTCHSRLRTDVVPVRDADAAARLKSAGGVLLGKSATHEFAFGGPTDDTPFPQPRNPWDTERYAGGSSSGAAVAVAARMALGSVGTDTGGSLRIPSSFCGVVSMKPSRGRINTEGVFPLAPSLDHVGPVAANAADCAVLFEALAVDGLVEPRMPADGLKGLTAGLPRDWIDNQAELSPAVRRALRQMEDLARDLGATTVDLAPPPLSEFRAAVSLLTAWEAYRIHAVDLGRQFLRYSDVFRRRVAPAALLDEADHASMIAAKTRLSAAFNALFEQCDFILMPATATTAPLLTGLDPLAEAARPSSFSQPTNLTGSPSLTIRAGFDRKGLPIGLQLVGPMRAEELLFAIACRIEDAMPRRLYRSGE
ncbi:MULTISPECIES: amidase [Chelativorans]|jgi:aspartyl-tRNA(Asn)/glutamyl-tRNA(Gln) amidotransferase subunit A|nr:MULTISPECIES: amidase [Chelativorans]